MFSFSYGYKNKTLMKVKFTLLILLIALGHTAFSQTFKDPAKGIIPPGKGVHQTHKSLKTVPAKQMELLAEALNGYAPSQTHNLYFRVNITNTDFEFGDSIAFTFPEGITINSVSNDDVFGPEYYGGDPEAFNGIDGQTISWGDNNNDFGGITSDNSVYTFSVNCTFDASLSGTQSIEGYLSGDQYDPASEDVTFTIGIEETQAVSRVQIIHNIADPLANKVDIRIDGAIANPALDNLDFRTASTFFDVSSSVPHEFSINDSLSTDASNALLAQTITLDPGVSYVIVLDGTLSETGFNPGAPLSFEIRPLAKENAPSPSEIVATFHNGTTDAPAFDIMEVTTFISFADDLAYTGFSDYVSVPLINFIINVTLDDGVTLVKTFTANGAGESGRAYTVLTSGFMNPAENNDGPSFGLWAAPGFGGALIELAEYVAENDVPCNAIDIPADGTPVDGSNIGGSVDPDEIAPPYGDCSGNFSWCDGEGANGQLDGTIWYSFTAPETGGVEVSTCNTNTDFDTQIAVYAVGDCTDYSTFTLLAANEDYDASGNCDAQSFFASRVSVCGLTPGTTYYVQVDGYAGDLGTVSISVAPLETSSCTAKVQFINNSADPALHNVDIRISGELTASDYDDLEFRYATATIDLPAGMPINITVNDPSSTDDSEPLFSEEDMILIPGGSYIMTVQGIVSETGYNPGSDVAPVNLNITNGVLNSNPSPNNTYLAFLNGSTDSPSIDIVKQYNGTGVLTEGLAYGDIDGYANESTINTTWAVYESGSSDIYASFNASLADFNFGGKGIVVFASGFYDPSQNNDGPAFGLFGVTSEGGMLIPFENVTGIENVNASGSFVVYPNPSTENFNIDFELMNAQSVEISLTNLLGQKVKSISLGMQNSGFNKTAISTDGISPGFYLMDITFGESRTTTKVQLLR